MARFTGFVKKNIHVNVNTYDKSETHPIYRIKLWRTHKHPHIYSSLFVLQKSKACWVKLRWMPIEYTPIHRKCRKVAWMDEYGNKHEVRLKCHIVKNCVVLETTTFITSRHYFAFILCIVHPTILMFVFCYLHTGTLKSAHTH